MLSIEFRSCKNENCLLRTLNFVSTSKKGAFIIRHKFLNRLNSLQIIFQFYKLFLEKTKNVHRLHRLRGGYGERCAYY